MGEESLLEFLTRLDHFPQAIRIEVGYDSPVSEEASLSQGEILCLHRLEDQLKAIARDARGDYFCIPLNYPKKIFESISNRCNEEYRSAGELVLAFPKYVRVLDSISECSLTAGTELELREVLIDQQGNNMLQCNVVGTSRSVSLSHDVVGPFQSFESLKPKLLREICDETLLPTRARVRGYQTKAYCGVNKQVDFRGLFTIERIVQEKVLLASTISKDILRVMKLPISLEVAITAADPPVGENLFSRICAFVDKEVDIDTIITTEQYRDASWMFDINKDIPDPVDTLPPKPAPKTAPKPIMKLKQHAAIKDGDPRYVSLPIKPQDGIKAARPTGSHAKYYPSDKRTHQPGTSPLMSARPQHLTRNSRPNYNGTNPTGNNMKRTSVETPKVSQSPNDAKVVLDEVGLYKTVNESTCETKGPQIAEAPSPERSQQHAQKQPSGDFVGNPQNRLKGISVHDVGEWLAKLGMSQYKDAFAEDFVDGDLLSELDNEMLQSLGVDNPLHQKKLMKFIYEGWTPKR